MGIPDDLSRGHHQLKSDRAIEKYKLMVSYTRRLSSRTLSATRPTDGEAILAAAILRPHDTMRVTNETQ
jgi:hypothetical protein